MTEVMLTACPQVLGSQTTCTSFGATSPALQSPYILSKNALLRTRPGSCSGAGSSAGQYDGGRGETDDALAVIAYGRQRWPGAQLWLAGFSFGGAVALRAAARGQAQRLITVAPGISTVSVTDAEPPPCPWLIVQGDADEVVPPEAVRSWAQRLSPAPELKMLPGASHFFHGRLNELRDVVLAFMREAETHR